MGLGTETPCRRPRPRGAAGKPMVALRQATMPEQFAPMKLRRGDVALILGLAVVYVTAARLGLMLDAVAGFATLVWPPTGISIAARLLFGNRLWPGVFLGAVTANLLTGAALAVALAIGASNTQLSQPRSRGSQPRA